MKLSQPVYQVLPVFVGDLILETSVQEIGWIHVPLFFLAHVLNDLRNKFYNRLWVSNLKNIIDIQLALVLLKPFFSTILLLFRYFLQLVSIKRSSDLGIKGLILRLVLLNRLLDLLSLDWDNLLLLHQRLRPIDK